MTHAGYLVEGSVRDNLLFGKSEGTEDEMIASLKKVNMWEELMERDGLDTYLQSKGANISGGQAQRISLARALLHDAQIYIFDEATSNIDVESEEIILHVIKSISKTKTVIFISHRLKNIENVDCIFVMQKGSILDQGTHKDLIKRNELYNNLVTEQLELEKYRAVGGGV